MISLRPYQQKAVDEIRMKFRARARSVLFVLPTGGGKCLGKGTPVLLHDGTTKLVEDITIRDKLMGPDSRPRNVISIARGSENLYRVNQINGDSYVVNESHILSLKKTASGFKYPCQKGGMIVNLSVKDYLSRSNTFKHTHKGWKSAVEFDRAEYDPDLPAYMLGVWLGDGNTRGAAITTIDPEILDTIHEYANERGMEVKARVAKNRAPIYYIKDVKSTHGRGHFANRFLNALRKANVFGNKHVPHNYKMTSTQIRLDVLAGLIDTDGSIHNNCYELVFKVKQLAEDAVYLARSVGLRAHIRKCQKTCCNTGAIGTYYRIGVSGDIDRIPCRIARKKASPRQQKKDVLVTGFSLEPIGIGDYYGFEIDGDHLFMLGDFTVTHNTYTFSYITDNAKTKGGVVLIVAHRQELVMQASLSLANLGVEHSLVTSGTTGGAIKVQHVREMGKCLVKPKSHVMVGSIQTIVRHLATMQKPTLIILDEGHHAVAGQWRELLEYFPDARVLGVTATPCRTDEKGLGSHVGGVYDDLVIGPTMRELIESGNLVPPKIYFPGHEIDLSGVRKTAKGDYNLTQLSDRIASERPTIVGDAVEWYRKIAPGKRAVVFCASVAAAQASAEAFNAAGYNFRSLDGSMDDSDRRDTVRKLGAGMIDGITSCDIVSEGFDCPGLEVAILLRPTASQSLYLQQVGRVLRPSPGKTHGIIIDHVGNVHRHLPPHWDREWTLDGGLVKHPGESEEGGEEPPQVRTCPKCFSVHDPMPKCPECGHIYKIKERKIEQVDGQLVEMTPEMEAELATKKKKRVEVGRAQTLEDLLVIEKARGYKPGWAKHVFQSRGR